MGNDKDFRIDCWNVLPDEIKSMATQIIKGFADKNLKICDANEVLEACKLFLDIGVTVNFSTGI